jgi:hypothetical protein
MQSITLEGIGAGPCPVCKSRGRNLDGIYSVVRNELFGILQKVDDFLLLQKALNTLKKEQARKKSPKNIKRKLCKKHPALNAVWSIFPNNRAEAYAFIGLLIALIGIILQMGGFQEKDKEIILDQTYQDFYSQQLPPYQRNNLSSNHIAPRFPPKPTIDI